MMATSRAGSVYVEFIIAILPMLLMFWGMLQVNGLLLADLVVRDAALNAVRAAVVIDTDDPKTDPLDATTGATLAAQDTVKAVKSIESVTVTLRGTSATGTAPVTARVTAMYHCQVPLVARLACALANGGGGTVATIEHSAELPNQGAFYKYH
jgi:Flp pilus assembly protein TadG